MKVKMMQVGPIATNCYILEDEQAHAAAIIDPGDEADRILSVMEGEDVSVEYILLTHGHYDHTTAVPQLPEPFARADSVQTRHQDVQYIDVEALELRIAQERLPAVEGRQTAGQSAPTADTLKRALELYGVVVAYRYP